MRDHYQLGTVLQNRRWVHRADPYPHIVAHNVFTPDFYAELDDEIRCYLSGGLSDAPAAGQFARSMSGYDAYGIALRETTGCPSALLLSGAWRDAISHLFGVGPTSYVFVGAHHHLPGSQSGFVHNDFNAVWFPHHCDNRSIQLREEHLCAYKTGKGALDAAEKVEVTRGAVVIIFVGNDAWRAGDGGEIGLYASGTSNADPETRYAPRNNSLIAFECTPVSFHGFMSNRRNARTSIIMWVHRTTDEAIERFGPGRFEEWIQ